MALALVRAAVFGHIVFRRMAHSYVRRTLVETCDSSLDLGSFVFSVSIFLYRGYARLGVCSDPSDASDKSFYHGPRNSETPSVRGSNRSGDFFISARHGRVTLGLFPIRYRPKWCFKTENDSVRSMARRSLRAVLTGRLGSFLRESEYKQITGHG